MNRLPLLLLPLLLGAAGTVQSPIINGDPVDSDVFPETYQLILSTTVDTSPFGGSPDQPFTLPQCTATLIAPDVVLTAGHCVSDFSITFGFLEAGELVFWFSREEDLSWMTDEEHQGNPPVPDDAVRSSGFVAHPGFSMENFQGEVDGPGRYDDIALVFLEEPLDAPFAWLPSEDEDDELEEGMEVDIVGYGQRVPTGQQEQPPPGTVYVRVAGTSFINELDDYEMQIGEDEDSTRKCHGDSGGPSFARVETDLSSDLRVVGVTSHAYDERDCYWGGVDTRVGPYLDWIEEEMIKACDDGLRQDCDEPGIRRPPEVEGDDGAGCQQSRGCQDGGGNALLPLLFLGGLGLRRRRS